MNELKKELENAYGLLSMLSFSGDAVDVAAACRMSMRRAISLASGDAPHSNPGSGEAPKPGGGKEA